MQDQPRQSQNPQFDELVAAISALLKERGRLSYRGIKRRFGIDDEYLLDLRAELVDALRVAKDEDDQVLAWCGPQSEAAPASAGVQHDTAERRQLTILFCDLVSSTELSTRCDPEDYRELMHRYHRISASTMARFGGYVAQYLGDGVQVYFGYPAAKDDASARAVYAAIELIRQLESVESTPRLPAVRIGIHTGSAIVADMGEHETHGERLALGETPNIAARLQALAVPNTVVVSDATRALLREPFLFESLGEHSLKGVDRPMALFRPHLPARAHGSQLSASAHELCGRVADLALLQARFDAACSGVGQLVAVSGEPGIGKTTLIETFRSRLPASAQQWEARCSAYHTSTALHPIAELLRRSFEIDDADPPQLAYEKLCSAMTAANQSEEARARFGALLSIGEPRVTAPAPLLDESPQAERKRTIELLSEFLLARSEQEPVLLVIEDLHWADPTTLEFLDTLCLQARATRAMILISHRAGFEPACGQNAVRTTVTLERLADTEASELVRQVTANHDLPEAVLRDLLSKSDGMPLFIEEMTRMLLSTSCLAMRGSRYELVQPLSSVGIPATITDSLMARIDQLGRAREVAQVAAVIGRSFSYELLAAVWLHDAALLGQYLDEAVRSGLLLQRGFPPHASYSFKHALVQEVAYDSLLRSQRKPLHARCADALVALFPQLVEAQPELVAHHYQQAGNADAACTYYQEAATKALQTAANVEAVRQVCKALDLIEQLPATPERDARELSLLIQLFGPLIATEGYASKEIEAVCERAQRLCASVGGPRERWSVLLGLWYNAEVRGAFVAADRLAVDIERLAQQQEADEIAVQLEIVRGHCFWRGRLAEARVHFERVIELYDESRHATYTKRFGQDPLVLALSYLNGVYSLQGDVVRGREYGERAIAQARRVGHPYSLVLAVGFAACCAQLRRDYVAVRRYADEVSKLAAAQGSSLWSVQGQILTAYCQALDGETIEGLAALEAGLGAWSAIGAGLWHTHQLSLVAEAHLLAGHIDESLLLIERAYKLAEKQGERYYSAELMRLQGEIELHRGPAGRQKARAHLHRAVERARAQGALLLEKRAMRTAQRAKLHSGVFSRVLASATDPVLTEASPEVGPESMSRRN
jgi:class 3 adenylate cyclase/predicted ATPase